MRVRFAITLALACGLLLAACGGLGGADKSATDGFPNKPVSLVVPYPPGGLTDTMARPLAQAAQEELGVPVAVVNRPGGGGTVGVSEVVEGRADGYTLAVGSAGPNAVGPHLVDLPYQGPDDYESLVSLGSTNLALVTSTKKRWQSFDDFMGSVKDSPGEITVGHAGAGSLQSVLLAAFQDETGRNLNLVPFDGGGPAITALLGGQVDAIMTSETAIGEHIRDGTVRGLALFSGQRSKGVLQGTPTLRDEGVSIERGDYLFLLAPNGTPSRVLDKLQRGFKAAIESNAFTKAAEENEFSPEPSMNPTEVERRVRSDFKYYGDVIRRLDLTG